VCVTLLAVTDSIIALYKGLGAVLPFYQAAPHNVAVIPAPQKNGDTSVNASMHKNDS